MYKGFLFYSVVFVLFLCGCSMYSSNPVGTSYHNVTSHFNAYFIANERIEEIESTLYDKYQWNYNKILPVYIPIDSNDANSVQTQIEDCIEKASIAIQRHEGSKWEDDSYILVGKARYYSLEYQDAIETFKYVNKKSDDDNTRHLALTQLIKTFVDYGEITNAITVSDFLKKEKLNKENQKDLYLVRAHLHYKRKDYQSMAENLVKAEALMKATPDRARIRFSIGQLFQLLENDSQAYKYYRRALKNNPDYELSFYTKLNMAQVAQLASTGDVKRTSKYFKKLLRDPKNKEYKDKIYYEMGNFELKQGKLAKAIENYKSSAASSVNNPRQKAYSYLKLGLIYYDSLKNFELAQAYYDSTVTTMPKDEENFDKVRQRQEILNDFILQINTINKNDSLLYLAKLPQDSLFALATSIVQEKEKEREEQKREEAKRQARQGFNSFGGDESTLIKSNLEGDTWYFYNPTALAKGFSEFRRKWGNTALEDNWRRSLRSDKGLSVESENTTAPEDTLSSSERKNLRLNQEIETLLASVPKSDEEISRLLSEVESAHYNLGNIYNFKLEEKNNAVITFEKLLDRFPESEYAPEVLYQLYLLYKGKQATLAQEKATLLKSQFPETVYAKLIDNPNYREENQAITAKLKKLYARAYTLYKNQQYSTSLALLDSALASSPENTFNDNLSLLAVLNTGELEGQYKYQYELNNFIKNFPESELVPYAKNLIESSENYQINLYNSAKAKFVTYFDQKHYLVVVYPNKGDLSQKISGQVDDYLNQLTKKITSGNLILDTNQAMILLNDFQNREKAIEFLKIFNDTLKLDQSYKDQKIYTFVISEDNFDIFYKTKDLNAYLNFFEKNY